jgi:hypothetical protein
MSRLGATPGFQPSVDLRAEARRNQRHPLQLLRADTVARQLHLDEPVIPSSLDEPQIRCNWSDTRRFLFGLRSPVQLFKLISTKVLPQRRSEFLLERLG